MPDSLVQPLFEGPLDIVGDVHGEIDALMSLMHHLGYDEDGVHQEHRRLVFVGDLTDRGPDSPAVVDLVQRLVDAGRAQCVLGNHDLNILLGEHKHDNHWLFGEEWSLEGDGRPITPAVLADDDIRHTVRGFFSSLPLALERSDLRVVHACWDDSMVDIVRRADDAVALYNEYVATIDAGHVASDLDEIGKGLEHQNLNPVKVLTSGKEGRTEEGFVASGKLRYEERVRWWEEYGAQQLCVFGHYSIYRGAAINSLRAVCADFAVAKRWEERTDPGFEGTFRGCLGAIRIPERWVVFDNGQTECLEAQPT